MNILRKLLALSLLTLLPLGPATADTLTIDGDLIIEGDTQIGTPTDESAITIHGPTGASAGNAITVTSDGGVVFQGTFGVDSTPVTSSGTSSFVWHAGRSALVVGNPSSGLHNVGDYSLSISDNPSATGSFSVAIGLGETGALGDGSFAHGFYALATASSSMARGGFTAASGIFASAAGRYTNATGEFSFAHGENDFATGNYSFAFGESISSDAYALAVFGSFNTDTYAAADPEVWVAEDPLFILGNGTSSTRSDAVVVKKNGETLLKGFGADSGEIVFKPRSNGDGGSYIQVDGKTVPVLADDQDPYLTQSEAESNFVAAGAANLGFFGATATHSGAIAAGPGNTTTADNQLLAGAYANADSNTAFAVGNGTAGQGSNALEVTSDGDSRVGRDLYVARNSRVYGDSQVDGVLRVLPSGDIGMGVFDDFDSDALSFFNRVSAEGITLDIQTREAISIFVESLKVGQDPVWAKLIAVWIFVGSRP